ncbi:hypothetical protein RSAG8_03812, partial [Rhizoctonia solani AG-8 WAC10335]
MTAAHGDHRCQTCPSDWWPAGQSCALPVLCWAIRSPWLLELSGFPQNSDTSQPGKPQAGLG